LLKNNAELIENETELIEGNILKFLIALHQLVQLGNYQLHVEFVLLHMFNRFIYIFKNRWTIKHKIKYRKLLSTNRDRIVIRISLAQPFGTFDKDDRVAVSLIPTSYFRTSFAYVETFCSREEAHQFWSALKISNFDFHFVFHQYRH